MPYRVVKHGTVWLTINTATHAVRGRHATRSKAVAQRRILEALHHRRKGKK